MPRNNPTDNNPPHIGKWVKANKDYCSYHPANFANRRKRGKIVGGSRIVDCYTIQWKGMARPECLHRTKFDFIDPLDEIFVKKVKHEK